MFEAVRSRVLQSVVLVQAEERVGQGVSGRPEALQEEETVQVDQKKVQPKKVRCEICSCKVGRGVCFDKNFILLIKILF